MTLMTIIILIGVWGVGLLLGFLIAMRKYGRSGKSSQRSRTEATEPSSPNRKKLIVIPPQEAVHRFKEDMETARKETELPHPIEKPTR